MNDPNPTDRPARPRWRRRWRIVLAGTVVVLAVAAVTLYFVFRESTTPINVEQAVDDFREATATTPDTTVPDTTVPDTTVPDTTLDSTLPAPGSDWPEPGVYTYATEGGESIDALDGRSHDYPRESTITVTHEGRCAVHRWRPLQERWDATTTCPSLDGQELRLYRSYHNFFNIDDTRDFECEPGSLWYPGTTEPGFTWAVQCATDDINVARTGTVVGMTTMEVGGVDVDVLTYELHDEISGASNGINDRTVTVVPDTGLIVELDVVVDVQNDSPIGDVHYEERYELSLTSLTPRR